MTAAVHIAATGAQTCLGLSGPPSAAAVRAGVSGVREHPRLRHSSGDPLFGAVAGQLAPDLTGVARLLALAAPALDEACAPLDGAPASYRRVPLFLAVPEPRPGFSTADIQEIEHALGRARRALVAFSPVVVVPNGHAAGLLALKMALEHMQSRAADVCMIGGVESYFNRQTIDWLEGWRQLASENCRSGFVPGEGAGFCLLASSRAAQVIGCPAVTTIMTVSTGHEENRIKTAGPCLGEGLSEAIGSVLASLPETAPVDDVICDLNGERYRGEEWGFASLRLSRRIADPTSYQSPADCWGDVGAASGPLFAMLACQARMRGYFKGPTTLLWASSEGGLRAAAMLHTAIS